MRRHLLLDSLVITAVFTFQSSESSTTTQTSTSTVSSTTLPPLEVGNWSQIDDDISVAEDDATSVSINDNGTIVAVSDTSIGGTVEIYQNTGSGWTLYGLAIPGISNVASGFGTSILLSADGTKVAIGAPTFSTATGFAEVYQYNGASQSWTRIGSRLTGTATGDNFGQSVSLSSNGLQLAVGANGADNSSNYDSGKTCIYDYTTYTTSKGGTTTDWLLKGTCILGESGNDHSGHDVSLSDSNVVAIGAALNDAGGTDSGHVRVFEYNSMSADWIQRGSDIDGIAAGDERHEVALSTDGTRLVVGTLGHDSPATNAGHVQIFHWDNTNWVSVFNDTGSTSGDFYGSDVSISNDGTKMCAGMPKADSTGSNSGKVKCHQWDGTTYQSYGCDIHGLGIDDRTGEHVKISGDGESVIVSGIGGPARAWSFESSSSAVTCPTPTLAPTSEAQDDEADDDGPSNCTGLVHIRHNDSQTCDCVSEDDNCLTLGGCYEDASCAASSSTTVTNTITATSATTATATSTTATDTSITTQTATSTTATTATATSTTATDTSTTTQTATSTTATTTSTSCVRKSIDVKTITLTVTCDTAASLDAFCNNCLAVSGTHLIIDGVTGDVTWTNFKFDYEDHGSDANTTLTIQNINLYTDNINDYAIYSRNTRTYLYDISIEGYSGRTTETFGGAIRIRSANYCDDDPPRSVTNPGMRGVTVQNNCRGFRIQDSSCAVVTDSVAINNTDNSFYFAAGNYLSDTGCHNSTFHNCTATNSGQCGFMIIGGSNCKVSDSVVDTSRGAGVHTFNHDSTHYVSGVVFRDANTHHVLTPYNGTTDDGEGSALAVVVQPGDTSAKVIVDSSTFESGGVLSHSSGVPDSIVFYNVIALIEFISPGSVYYPAQFNAAQPYNATNAVVTGLTVLSTTTTISTTTISTTTTSPTATSTITTSTITTSTTTTSATTTSATTTSTTSSTTSVQLRPTEYVEFALDLETNLSGVPIRHIKLAGNKATFATTESAIRAHRLCAHFKINILVDLYQFLGKPFPGFQNQEVFNLHACIFDHCCTPETCITDSPSQSTSTTTTSAQTTTPGEDDQPPPKPTWRGVVFMNGVYMDTRLQDGGEQCNNSTETTTVKLVMEYDEIVFTQTGVANMTSRQYEVNVTDDQYDSRIFHDSPEFRAQAATALRTYGVHPRHRRRRTNDIGSTVTVGGTVTSSEIVSSQQPALPPPSPSPSTEGDDTTEMLPIIIGVSVGFGVIALGVAFYQFRNHGRSGYVSLPRNTASNRYYDRSSRSKSYLPKDIM